MNNVNTTYINLLKENGHKDIKANYKRYLKQLIIESIKTVRFIKPVRKNESEMICCESIIDEAVENTLKNNSDDMATVFKAAKIIRKEIIESSEWKFEGSFQNYEQPQILTSLLKWVIAGPKNNIEATSKKEAVIDVCTEHWADN